MQATTQLDALVTPPTSSVCFLRTCIYRLRACFLCPHSVVPKELEADANPASGTDVKLVDKRNEEYVAPAYVAFGGDGQTMG